MLLTPDKPAGGTTVSKVDGSKANSPQLTIVPSLRRARLRLPPAAIATTLLRPAGTPVPPHSTTVPLLRNTSPWLLPAATLITSSRPVGTGGPAKLTTEPAAPKRSGR